MGQGENISSSLGQIGHGLMNAIGQEFTPLYFQLKSHVSPGFRDVLGHYRTFDLESPEGIGKEFDLMEEVTGLKFSNRPQVVINGSSKSSAGVGIDTTSYYNAEQNTMGIANIDTIGKRGRFWHEGTHALLCQHPIWEQHVPTLKPIYTNTFKSGDTFPLLRQIAMNEGLTVFLGTRAIRTLSQYLTEGPRSRLLADVRDEKRRADDVYKDRKKIIENAHSIQQNIEHAIECSDTGQALTQISTFLEMDIHYLGISYIFRLVYRERITNMDDLISFVTKNPPKSWEEFIH